MTDSDEKCVCGHKVSEHTAMLGSDRGCRHMVIYPGLEIACECNKCRPALDWPADEGDWWCGGKDFAPRLEFAGAQYDGEVLLYMRGYGYTRQEFERTFKGVKFTRLLEPNPFAP